MTKNSPHTYRELTAVLATELRQLALVSQELREKDAQKFRMLRKICPSCGRNLDWFTLFTGGRVARDVDGNFDVNHLVEVEDPIRCFCGALTGFDFLFRRGSSERSEERRRIFRSCSKRLEQQSELSSEQIQRFLRLVFRLSITDSVTGLSLPTPQVSDHPVIRLTGVERVYKLGTTDVHALRGIDLTVRQREFVALVGASGAGKSTLMNMIGCIDLPTRGHVEIDGLDVTQASESQRTKLRNRRIGFIFQAFNLLHVLNVFENVELPLLAQPELTGKERRERTLKAIDDVQLTKYIRHRPDQLSGGQRQRVAVARALVTSPAIVIADEPTANLDSATAHHIVNLMAEMNETHGVTFLFSTHDEKLISRVRSTIKIADGRIAPRD